MNLQHLEFTCQLYNNSKDHTKEYEIKMTSMLAETVNYTNIGEIIQKQYHIICTLLDLFDDEKLHELTFMGQQDIIAQLAKHNNSAILPLMGIGYPMPTIVANYAIENGNDDIIFYMLRNGYKMPDHILNIAKAHGYATCISHLKNAGYESD
jgi:hypothetical protein